MPAERSQLVRGIDVAGTVKVQSVVARKTRLVIPPWVIRIAAWVTLLIIWEIYGRSKNPTLFTYPTAVAKAFVLLVNNGELWRFAKPSLKELSGGLFFSTIFAIPFGVAMARFRYLDNWFDTYVAWLYATPSVALVPVVVLWFGIDIKAKIIIVCMFATFPLLINTIQGVKHVDESLLEVARSFRSSEWRTWIDVVIPSAVPFIVTGLRLAVGRALIGTILAEMYTSITGLGYMITTYANSFQTAKMFVPIVTVGCTGLLLTSLLNWMEQKFAPWRMGGH